MYMHQPNLTMNNIEDVISLAKQSLSDEYLSICEMFLKDSLTSDTMFRIYQLALLYDVVGLKAICEDEICVFAETMFKSPSLLDFSYEYLQMILQRDALACEEIDIFNACMAWAITACKRSNLDPSSGKSLRGQLRDSLHQIRFNSMTKEEASRCIRLYSGLFTADELEEIICMVALQDEFRPKQFNWTPRYYDLNCYKGRRLQFSLAEESDGICGTAVNSCDASRFSCNRRVLLKSFHLQNEFPIALSFHVIIKESRSNENEIIRFDQQLTVHFKAFVDKDYTIYEAEIMLNKPILLRPQYHYEICIEFDRDRYGLRSHAARQMKKRIDHDIKYHFEPTGIVSGMTIYRFDSKNYFQKVFHDPKTWMVITSVGAGVFLAFFVRNILQPPTESLSCVVPEPDVLSQSLFGHFVGFSGNSSK